MGEQKRSVFRVSSWELRAISPASLSRRCITTTIYPCKCHAVLFPSGTIVHVFDDFFTLATLATRPTLPLLPGAIAYTSPEPHLLVLPSSLKKSSKDLMLNFSECTSFMLRLARASIFGGHLFPAYTAAEHELISLHFEMPRHDIGSFLLARRSLFGGGVPTHQPTFGVFLPTGMLHSRLHLRAPLPRTPSVPCSTSLLWTKDVLAYLYKIDSELEDDTHWAAKRQGAFILTVSFTFPLVWRTAFRR